MTCAISALTSCGDTAGADAPWIVDRFDDIKVIRYEVPGFDELPLREKELIYYLAEAAKSGRDILYDQNCRMNLPVRRTLEVVYENYTGDRTAAEWKALEKYLKKVWFANGIHHHYSNDKFCPEFTEGYLLDVIETIPEERFGELNALRGDFGTSYVYAMPVASLLHGKLGVTALLTAIAFVLIVAVSLPVGLFAASRQGGWLDRALTVLGQVVMAVPPFVVGILLTLLCGLVLRWFDPGAFISPDQSFWRSVGYLIYPAVAIALPRIAMTVRMLKSSIVGELNKDYVRTAYSRGNSPRATLYRHVLRNAVVPTVAFLAMTVADIVAGSVIIEQVFAIPGIGRLLLTSIANRDFPVVQAIVVILALWVVLVNCLADILNQRLDPRLRLQ